MSWFETHAHLGDSQFDADRDDALARSFQAGIGTIVEIADGPDEWAKAQGLHQKYPGQVLWAAGIHPYYADQPKIETWAQLKLLSASSGFVAIGEIGLDYAKCKVPHDVQQSTFLTALRLAEEVEKPVIVHCREAYTDLLPILRSHFGTTKRTLAPGVIHCFSGTIEDARAVIDLGFYLGIDGPVTYPNSNGLRDVLQQIPLSHWVLETDSPYLPPQPFRGKPNEPTHLPLIGAEVSKVTGQTTDHVRAVTGQNAANLFRLKHP